MTASLSNEQIKVVEKMIHKNLKHFYAKIDHKINQMDMQLKGALQRDSVYNQSSVSDPMGILDDVYSNMAYADWNLFIWLNLELKMKI